MATTTPNFGWPVPTSSDLVKNGATAIEALGDGIDASLLDLKGGTSGQVLKKNSNTDMDFVWGADSAGMTNPMTTTGDTIYSSSGSTPARLGIGSTGQVLTVSGGVPTWAAAGGGGGMTLISTTTLSGASTTISVASNSYKNLVMWAESIDTSGDVDVFFQLNGETGATAYVPVVQGSNNNAAYTYYTATNGVYLNQPGLEGFGTGSDNSSDITIYNANSTIRKVINAQVGALVAPSNRVVPLRNTCTVGSSAVISSIVWKVASGTFSSGTIKLYGVS
jgi:hypothetical protein